MKKLIIFLIRKKLGLKKGEHFKFANQLSKYNTYYFTDDAVMKRARARGAGNGVDSRGKHYMDIKSSVSLNWLLDDECEIVRVEDGR